jgi:predicted unusual protein kinase regulating ubiquinone biosynthesis (AarF/ABC1/UbiB family)
MAPAEAGDNRAMSIALGEKLGLYRKFLVLLTKHAGPRIWNSQDSQAEHDAESLVKDLEDLGPTFVKLGQLLASRADLLPESYLTALNRLQDEVTPCTSEEIRRVIREEFDEDPESIFASFDWEPMAAASLGQVHRATLVDGTPVVVKVQRPAVEETFQRDLAVVSELAHFLENHTDVGERYRFGVLVDDLEKNLRRELDYRMEARNLEQMGRTLGPYSRLTVPRPFARYSGRRVLTMELMEGTRVDQAVLPERDALKLAGEIFDAYLEQIFINGHYHADPHPGNILVLESKQAAIIDLGLMGHVEYALRHHMVLILFHIAEERADRVAALCLQIGERRADADEPRFRRRIRHLVHSYHELPLNEMRVGDLLLELCSASGECGIMVPPQLALLAKTMLHLDQVGKALAPSFCPQERMRERLPYLLLNAGFEQLSPSDAAERLYQLKQLAYEAPAQLQALLADLAEGEFGVNLKIHHINELMTSFAKVANRIAAGLVLGSMVVGAAIMMRVRDPSGGGLWGYPTIAMVVFLLAVLGGFYLVASVFYHDRMRN